MLRSWRRAPGNQHLNSRLSHWIVSSGKSKDTISYVLTWFIGHTRTHYASLEQNTVVLVPLTECWSAQSGSAQNQGRKVEESERFSGGNLNFLSVRSCFIWECLPHTFTQCGCRFILSIFLWSVALYYCPVLSFKMKNYWSQGKKQKQTTGYRLADIHVPVCLHIHSRFSKFLPVRSVNRSGLDPENREMIISQMNFIPLFERPDYVKSVSMNVCKAPPLGSHRHTKKNCKMFDIFHPQTQNHMSERGGGFIISWSACGRSKLCVCVLGFHKRSGGWTWRQFSVWSSEEQLSPTGTL